MQSPTDHNTLDHEKLFKAKQISTIVQKPEKMLHKRDNQ